MAKNSPADITEQQRILCRCPFDKMLKSADLKHHPKNPNSHDEEQINRLAEILKYQGWRYPIKVSNQSGYITSGHGRLAAALKLGLTEVPISFQDYDNEDQEYADLVADNAIASWSILDRAQIDIEIKNFPTDFNLDLLGIKDFSFDANKLDPQCDEDEVPEKVEAKTKLGDLYKLGKHRLMCGSSGDMESVDSLFSGSRASLCFTSPPYSDMREYNGGKDLSVETLAKFLEAPADLFVMNLGIQRKDGNIFPYWDVYISHAKSIGLNFLAWNVWDKLEAGSIGNMSAIFPIEHEFIFVFGKEKIEINKTEKTKHAGVVKSKFVGARSVDGSLDYKYNPKAVSDMKKMGSVYRASPEKARNLGHDHPAVFPVHFPESFILACTNPNEVVYEPFCGSGTSLIAAQKSNRICFGMELDPHYCDVIVARWEKYTGKKAELAHG